MPELPDVAMPECPVLIAWGIVAALVLWAVNLVTGGAVGNLIAAAWEIALYRVFTSAAKKAGVTLDRRYLVRGKDGW